MKKYRGLSLERDYTEKKISGKLEKYIGKNFGFFLILIPIYCRHFSKIGRGCKKIFTRKNDFFGGGGLFWKLDI